MKAMKARRFRWYVMMAGWILASAGLQVRAQHAQAVPYPAESDLHTPFLDSIIKTLSIEDMAAQTLILRTKAVPTPEYIVEMRRRLESHPFGGICFFAGTTPDMLTLQKAYKAASRLPLLFSIDGEFGAGMRLTDLHRFPRQQTLGAVSDPQLIYEMGQAVGRQCRLLGIQWNFLPVADVNNNPLNPVINTRSFGENPSDVARLASLYLKGMQSEGVMGSVKHFPGHGDTKTDSHLALPLIALDKNVLDSIHLAPFRKLIQEGVESVMVGHLNIPAYDSSGLPASLSPLVVTRLLREELGYRGLIVTDGLEMQGVRKTLQSLPNYKETGEGAIEVQALRAGCDVLLLPKNPEAAVKAIAHAVKTGRLPRERLENACRRILYYKFYPTFATDYNRYPQAETLHNLPRFIEDSLNGAPIRALRQDIYDHAVTVMDNINEVLPLSPTVAPRKIALHIGTGEADEFSRTLAGFDPSLEQLFLGKDFNYSAVASGSLLNRLKDKDLILLSITNTNYNPNKNYGISEQTLRLCKALQDVQIPVVLCVFASPYALLSFYDMPHISAAVCGYQDVDESKRACARVLYGALPATGHLPVRVAKYWPAGFGITTSAWILDFDRTYQESGLSSETRRRIDSLATTGLEQKAYPGCQILIARKGKVIYDQCFGTATYDSLSAAVQPNSLYDLASLTKILATTLAYMRLYENGEIALDEPIRNYLPRLGQTNKKHITFRQTLTHQAGLKAFIPYVDPDLMHNGKPVFDSVYSSNYPLQVADRLFLIKDYDKEIRKRIDETPVNPRRPYVYSDLGFYYLNEALRKITDTTLDGFVEREFYAPLGLKTLGFRPLNRFPLYQIMPTENDTLVRKRQIRGYVHDPLAAFSNGVAGSAGLFGCSRDVAVIGQMLLQNGFYGGIQFFDSATVKAFTSCRFSQADNRRGGGFDKPPFKKDDPSPTCASASSESFGHSGFTGTYLWVDPSLDLVYVFLSNRVYPDSHNKKLNVLGIRTSILELLYEE